MISEKSKDVLDNIRHKYVRKNLILWNLNFVYNLFRTKCSYKSHKRINFIQHNAFENLTVTQLIKKFSAFHGTGTVIVSAQKHAMEFITKFSTDVLEYSDAFITRQFTFNKSIHY